MLYERVHFCMNYYEVGVKKLGPLMSRINIIHMTSQNFIELHLDLVFQCLHMKSASLPIESNVR